jgi:hypothetical protein
MAEKMMTGKADMYFAALQRDRFLGEAGVEEAEVGAMKIEAWCP